MKSTIREWSLRSILGSIARFLVKFNQGYCKVNIIRDLKRLRSYLLREVMLSEHTFHNTIGQIALLALHSLNTVGRSQGISSKLRRFLEEHRANHIMRKYKVKLTYPLGGFPPDLFWRDYSQIPDFLNAEVIIDAGASIGDFAIVMCKTFKAKKVIAIEPSEVFYSYLIRNIKANDLISTVMPLKIALGDKEGEIILYERGLWLSGKGGGTPRKYPCTTLDLLVRKLKLQRIDLIKIDTEGFELPIIGGLRKY